jgi:hypothetical protein
MGEMQVITVQASTSDHKLISSQPLPFHVADTDQVLLEVRPTALNCLESSASNLQRLN